MLLTFTTTTTTILGMVFGILEKLGLGKGERGSDKETPEKIFLDYILSLLDRDPRHKALHDAIEGAGTVIGRTRSVMDAVGWENFSASYSNWQQREASRKDYSDEFKALTDELTRNRNI